MCVYAVKTDETMTAAISEMMERIKRGDALRPVDGRKQSAPTLLRRVCSDSYYTCSFATFDLYCVF